MTDTKPEEYTYYVFKVDGELQIDVWKDKKGERYKPLMECGHTAQAITYIPNSDALMEETGDERNNIPIHCCVICDCRISVEGDKRPILEGRKAKCDMCKNKTDSRYTLAFFKHCPEKEYDKFYCGCQGWN